MEISTKRNRRRRSNKGVFKEDPAEDWECTGSVVRRRRLRGFILYLTAECADTGLKYDLSNIIKLSPYLCRTHARTRALHG